MSDVTKLRSPNWAWMVLLRDWMSLASSTCSFNQFFFGRLRWSFLKFFNAASHMEVANHLTSCKTELEELNPNIRSPGMPPQWKHFMNGLTFGGLLFCIYLAKKNPVNPSP